MTKKKQFFITFASVILLVLIDFVSKRLALSGLTNGDFVIWDGVLRFSLVFNTGAVFGLFSDGTVFLSIISLVLFVLVAFVYNKIPLTKRMLPVRVICVFIMAGAVGNLIDRVFYHFVVDFIYFQLINFYVFNIADCYITVSVILLLLLYIFKYKDEDFSFLTRTKKSTDDEHDNM